MNGKTKLNLFQANKEFDENRKENSIKCCQLLIEYFEKNPQIRFWQAIQIIDTTFYKNQSKFYEEPEDTYLKLKEFVK